MTINIYTTNNCVKCMMTKKQFAKADVAYNDIDLDSDDAIRPRMRDLGFTSAPVIEILNENNQQVDIWSGFQPNKIKQYS